MVHISQDSVLVALGVIGSGSALAYLHQKTGMDITGINGMWLRMILGGALLYFGQMEDQDFLSLIGFGMLVAGIDEYLISTGQVASAGEIATNISNKVTELFTFDEKVDMSAIGHTIEGELSVGVN